MPGTSLEYYNSQPNQGMIPLSNPPSSDPFWTTVSGRKFDKSIIFQSSFTEVYNSTPTFEPNALLTFVLDSCCIFDFFVGELVLKLSKSCLHIWVSETIGFI